MKKILTILFVFIAVIALTGCSCSRKNNKNEGNKTEDNRIFVDGIEFTLDTDKEFNGLTYKMDSKITETNPYTDPKSAVQRQYIYRKETDNSNKITIRMFYYKDKTVEYALNDLGKGTDTSVLFTVEAEHMSLKMFDVGQEKGTGHFYFATNNNDVIAIQIGSYSDIKQFEAAFLKTLKFKEA